MGSCSSEAISIVSTFLSASLSPPQFNGLCMCLSTFLYLQENPRPNSVQLHLSSSSAGLGLRKPTAAELEVLYISYWICVKVLSYIVRRAVGAWEGGQA
jgi:hypothetical protein